MGKLGQNSPVVTKPQYQGQKRKITTDHDDEEVDFPKKICRKYQKSVEEIKSSSENDSSDNEESDSSDSEESDGPGEQVPDKSQGIEQTHLNSNRRKSFIEKVDEYISSESDDYNDDDSGKDTRDIDKSTQIDEYISSESDSNDDIDVNDDGHISGDVHSSLQESGHRGIESDDDDDDDVYDEEKEEEIQESTILKNVSGIKLHKDHRSTAKQVDGVQDQNDGSESLSSSNDDDCNDTSDDDNSIDIVDDGDKEKVKDELTSSKSKEVLVRKSHPAETKDMQNIIKQIIGESRSSSESDSSYNEESDDGSDDQVPDKSQSGKPVNNDRTKQLINEEIDEYISSESDDNNDSSGDDEEVTDELKLRTSTKLKAVSKVHLIDSVVKKRSDDKDKQLSTINSSSADGMSSDSSDSEVSEDKIDDDIDNDNNEVKDNSSIDVDDDEVETGENDEPEDDFAAVKKELANIPLEDLMKIKEKLGLKTFNRIMHGEKFEEKKQKVFKRENKNRPMELSSKKRVPVMRQAVVAKEKVSRDPRFDDLSGEFQDKHFMKNYSFLDDIKSKEKLLVQKKMNKTKDESKKKDLAKLLNKMNQQEQTEEKKRQKLELEQEWKEKERQLVKEGKAPYFLKKSEQKKLELAEKFKQLQKSGKVDQFMSKKLKKNAQKEKKKLPDRHQRFM